MAGEIILLQIGRLQTGEGARGSTIRPPRSFPSLLPRTLSSLLFSFARNFRPSVKGNGAIHTPRVPLLTHPSQRGGLNGEGGERWREGARGREAGRGNL